MEKKIYDLSVGNQSASERRELIADSGKKYDVSFVPAIVNRKYYAAWCSYQQEIMSMLGVFSAIQNVAKTGGKLTEKDNKFVKDFLTKTKEAATCGIDLIVFTMKANGYDDFTEDELLTNFSENGIALAINFIMGIDNPVDAKKKASNLLYRENI